MYRIIFTQNVTSFQYYSTLITCKLQHYFITFYKLYSTVTYLRCELFFAIFIGNYYLQLLLILISQKKNAMLFHITDAAVCLQPFFTEHTSYLYWLNFLPARILFVPLSQYNTRRRFRESFFL